MTGKVTGLVDRINHASRSNLVLQARFRPRRRSGHYGFQQYSPLDRRLTRMLRQTLAGFVVALALLLAPATTSAQQPPTTAAQEGFVPVDESKPQEHLPAAPLVMTAYAVAWVAIFGYVWSLWSRLSKVEREIAEVSRRVDAGSRR